MIAPLLQAEGLHKRFGGVLAVQGIGFAMAPDSIMAIIGPNGAGKSTMMNLLSGLYRPDQGRLVFGGATITALPPHRRARLGLARTFQKIRLFRNLGVLENVLVGFHLHRHIPLWQYLLPGPARRAEAAATRAAAVDLLEFVGLAGQIGARAGSLSYGQQRMLEIARALATRPRLLLLDEPAAGMNPAEVAMLGERLHAVRARGTSLIVVEHNMELVMSLAQHVLVMDHGQPLFAGPPHAVQENPAVIAAYLGGAAP